MERARYKSWSTKPKFVFNGVWRRTLIELSSEVLATDVFPEKNGLFRQIVKEPVGVVFVIVSDKKSKHHLQGMINKRVFVFVCVYACAFVCWICLFGRPLGITLSWRWWTLSFQHFYAVGLFWFWSLADDERFLMRFCFNTGNAVVIKHSPRTPLCGNHYVDTMAEAGLPTGLVSSMNASHEVVAHVLQRPEIGFVSFTGSVRGWVYKYSIKSKKIWKKIEKE